jgi:hypothetical protein
VEKATRSVKKSELRSVLLSEPDALRDLIVLYKKKPAATYDYATDPSGEFIWFRASRQYTKQFPLKIKLPKTPTGADVQETVKTICEKFRDLIENNALSSLLYNDSTGKPKKEELLLRR